MELSKVPESKWRPLVGYPGGGGGLRRVVEVLVDMNILLQHLTSILASYKCEICEVCCVYREAR